MRESTKDTLIGLIISLVGVVMFLSEYNESGTPSSLVLVLAVLVIAAGLGISIYANRGGPTRPVG